jgi:mono/diheme cytochrome c family protein
MRWAARVLFLAIACALVAWAIVARPHVPPAERGRRLAERWGCFTCHGPGGIRGVANHGRADRTVPGFEGDVMMYAKNDSDLVEWIRDGVIRRKAESRSWREQRDRGALRMPAFGRVLTDGQIADLAAYVNACAGNPSPDEDDTLATAGLGKIEALGCTGCHGPGGRLATRNPGSLKGYVPSWDGPDFAELVRDRAEFDQWVTDGTSRRFETNPVASWLLRRAALHMPAYRDHVTDADLDTLWAYVGWLRGTPHEGLRASPGPR